jgi:hypothetical protein
MNERIATLGNVLKILEELRQHELVIDGDAAVEWVIEQLTEVE